MSVSLASYLFIFMYGLAAFIGLALAVFWGRVGMARLRHIDHLWHQDRYFLICLGFGLVAGGQSIIDIGRTVGNIEFGLSRILVEWPGYLIFSGMFTMIAGLFVMTWLADLETHPPDWRWLKRTGVVTVVWAALSFVINFYVPIYPPIK